MLIIYCEVQLARAFMMQKRRLKIMRIIDRTGQALGRTIARTRNVSDIRRIAIHHSATASGNSAIFENSWRNNPRMGAPNAVGGYHEVILLNGDLELNYLPTRVSHGVGGQNGDTYNICVVGNFTQAQLGNLQLQTLLERIRFNVNRFPNVTFDRVLGHREFPNQSTNCPPFNMTNIRNQARQIVTPPPINNTANTHVVRSGETLTGIAQRNRTTVLELQRLNNINNVNFIRVGQVLQLPTSSNNVTTSTALRVGSRVRVNQAARTWATGQAIPAFVRGQTYTVQQLRNSNREVLLAGVMSWIRATDITVV